MVLWHSLLGLAEGKPVWLTGFFNDQRGIFHCSSCGMSFRINRMSEHYSLRFKFAIVSFLSSSTPDFLSNFLIKTLSRYPTNPNSIPSDSPYRVVASRQRAGVKSSRILSHMHRPPQVVMQSSLGSGPALAYQLFENFLVRDGTQKARTLPLSLTQALYLLRTHAP